MLNIPSVMEINQILEDAKKDVIKDATHLGMKPSCGYYKGIFEQVSLSAPGTLLSEMENDLVETTEETAYETESQKDDMNSSSVNAEDLKEMSAEMEIFSEYTALNIKDYKEKRLSKDRRINSVDRSFLKIVVNNKTMVVRKSTLCWLFLNKTGRLSSDRIHRVRGMTQKSSKNRTPKASASSVNENGSETSETGSYSSQSEFEHESFSEDNLTLESGQEKITLIAEQYYAVRYNAWYIGRIIDLTDDRTCRMKFLKSELENFIWPKELDVQNVDCDFIFYGPIELIGNGPFQLKRYDRIAIEKCYKLLKKN